jgi:hypothetical protein
MYDSYLDDQVLEKLVGWINWPTKMLSGLFFTSVIASPIIVAVIAVFHKKP